jgi:hypothetical protein
VGQFELWREKSRYDRSMDPVAILDQLRTDYPKMSAAALVGTGFILGWAAGWFLLRHQITTYKARLEHAQDVIAGTIPAATYRPIQLKKERSMIAGFALLILGLTTAAVGTALLLRSATERGLKNPTSTANEVPAREALAAPNSPTPLPVTSQAAPALPSAEAPPATTIEWKRSFGMMRAGNSTIALLLEGTSPQTKSLTLRDAFLESGLTGEVIKMMVAPNTPNLPHDAYPISEANPLPPKGFIRLIAVMGPDFHRGLADTDLIARWRTIWFNAIYENEKSDRISFDMEPFFPEIAGPHATKKNP